MAVELPSLPYPKNALEPHISANTLDFHHGKHHQAYVTNTNKLIENSPMANDSLIKIITQTAGNREKTGLFNNAAQVWNHSFYWNCMKPGGGGRPNGQIAGMIEEAFDTYDNFAEAFRTAAATQFGSGWAWLVLKNDQLEIMKTANADTPIAHDIKPLLTVDVWEHAYYLDYQNRRDRYVETFLDHLVNWEFAAANLGET